MSWDLDKLENQAKSAMKNIEHANQNLISNTVSVDKHLAQIQSEYRRVAEASHNAHVLIEDVDRSFKEKTKLTDYDIAFLFLCTALQCARQYLLTPSKIRKGDQEAASEVKGKEYSNRSHRLYNPSLEEILSNPVPYDATMGAKKYEALKGYGSLGHRGATPGHDPVLGLIFGTANIATSTLTNWSMESFHIYSGTIGSAQGVHDIFKMRARTSSVISHTADKLLHQGFEGKQIIGAAVAKEILHLRSDVYSKDSLPLPFISAIDPVFAGNLAKHGLDMANALNAGKQFTYAVAIDALIALIHGLFYDESVDFSHSAFDVRTRRILIYSNLLASTSNIVISQFVGKQYTDWGGYANTLRRIVFDTKFIKEVKCDFLKNELYNRIVGSDYDFMEG